ncbi:hypothetical protein ASPZODRAFT_18092 [Penicilliopsis zonata CBS 506.65]|uniref:Diphthine--ammonia ligase n=1 Tax=Penicilliopsis zonata CBS 506.65 TaxID=1073090 RepID=A0A1L9SBF6_9EURO|nr:hypothetical protein ASPZODRAFT_18092 [Penicilliopsis zonata CBS 506.65]OJJ44513.1 hypothetical protein ASPZODRAFT_18092 [Penicilliopsis zonata CBS 506.65]
MSLKVIALISGGKDSLYTPLHCLANGHTVVALANLHPASQEEEDIDSFMYQTVGHGVIPLYEEALGIPLYRAEIQAGSAIETSLVYGAQNSADETEALVPLLKTIMETHHADAVCTGAILSTYQRTRIESVAARLGLVSLSWLWMYPFLLPGNRTETALLEDMASVSCDARIIKVASGGLDSSFLWGNVSSSDGRLRSRIAKAMARFVDVEDGDVRGAVLGEGGEYETLAVDGPSVLWKKRIEVDTEVVSGEAGVSYLRFTRPRCLPKESGEPFELRRPPLLEDRFERLLQEHQEQILSESVKNQSSQSSQSSQSKQSKQSISNLTAAGTSAAEQMASIATTLDETLAASNRTTDDIVFATLLLRSMADFASVNDVYVSLFRKPNPPARVTVACRSLPAGVDVMASFVLDSCPREKRDGLHVQSRSYWAPANIGPYSQAISVPLNSTSTSKLVYVAGQIPLEPASMNLPVTQGTWMQDFNLQAVLALQHLWRIGAAMHVDWWTGGVAFLTGENVATKAWIASRIWEGIHNSTENIEKEEEDDVDAWDLKYGRAERHYTSKAPALPNFDIVESSSPAIPPFFAVQVDELPRNSSIEWQSAGLSGGQLRLNQETKPYGRCTHTLVDGVIRFSAIEVDWGHLEAALHQLSQSQSQSQSHQATIYTAQQVSWPGQIVPCKAVWGRGGRRLAAGILLSLNPGSC